MQPSTVIKSKSTNYVVLQDLGSGTYGRVVKAYDQNDPTRLVAIKVFHLEEHEDEGVPATSIRELDILRTLDHPNIVDLYEVHYSRPTDGSPLLIGVFELCAHDLKKHCKIHTQMLKERYPDLKNPIAEHTAWTKELMFQLLNGMAYCHAHNIMHRDLKPQNVLMGMDGVLKIGDFGLARACRLPLPEYTHDVLTMWYRAPEILLGIDKYSPSVDVWSVGCIMAELLRGGHALLPGECEIDMVWRIFRYFGTPTEKTWPEIGKLKYFDKNFPVWNCNTTENLKNLCKLADASAIDLLSKLLVCNPNRRISCKGALEHPWFDDIDRSKYVMWDSRVVLPSPRTLNSNFNEQFNDENVFQNNRVGRKSAAKGVASDKRRRDSERRSSRTAVGSAM
ncbi:cell division control 28 [Cryptosporidium bovis]|uniref:cell division control 28 n=1 Tax=Cryptosporidium bovis TaxID=310047 RepID=UPI00351A3436|nr:cell division control 28 [Cryptosporidium bovis]